MLISDKEMTPDEGYRLAVSLYGAKEREKAKAILEQVLTVEPAHVLALNGLGIIALDEGCPEKAREYVAHALDLDPSLEKAWNTLGTVELRFGRLAEAEKMYRTALSLNPAFVEAWGNLGSLLLRRGKGAEAAEALRRATDLRPDSWQFHGLLGDALLASGSFPEAECAYGRALELNPRIPSVCNGLGNCLARQGKPGEAEGWFRRALEIAPKTPLFLNNLGNVLAEAGRVEEALDWYRQAVAIDPGYADAFANLGDALTDCGRHEEALAAYHHALALRPGAPGFLVGMANPLRFLRRHDAAKEALGKAVMAGGETVDTLNGFGALYSDLGRLDEASECFRRSLEIAPDSPKTLTNLGEVLISSGRLDEARSVLERALALAPASVLALSNLGVVLARRNEPVKALDMYRRAVETDPAFSAAWVNMAGVLWQMGKLQEALEALEHVAACGKETSELLARRGDILLSLGKVAEADQAYREALRLDPGASLAHASRLFAMNYSPAFSAEEIYRESREWERTFAGGETPQRDYANTRVSERRLRIGYVSPDFRDHAVSYFFSSVMQGHDRNAVEVLCYADVPKPDLVTFFLRSLADTWRDVHGMSDAALAETIREDRIDILVDLAGHTAGNRLLMFALKPAPVQVTWLGYPGTTGLAAIDYRITDAVADPPGPSDLVHAEKLVRLPAGFLCYAPPESAPPVSSPPFLRNGCITFGTFNNPTKISEETARTWGTILRRLPDARLLLKNKIFCEKKTEALFRAFFREAGLDPERVTFLHDAVSTVKHLETYRRIDVSLDPFPYNGTTTTCESLLMGVPTVVLLGNRHAARVGGSILARLGLEELVARTPDEYVEIAVRLATDPERLRTVRRSLRKRLTESPLCDAREFSRQLEEAYRQMWHLWCSSRKEQGTNC